jgi:hypothetical protein
VKLLRRRDSNSAVACVRSQIESSRNRIFRALIDDRVELPLR